MKNLHRLEQLIADRIDPGLSRYSRIHPLRGFLPQRPEAPLYIKREDELSAGVVGGKLRKYLSLIPALVAEEIDEVLVIGSAHSNNVMGLAQMFGERGIATHAFVKSPGNKSVEGNLLMLKMLLPEERIHYIPNRLWPEVNELARTFADQRRTQGIRAAVIPEGADHPEALPGSMTAALDLLRNETESGLHFDGIWTDSGSGVAAIGLLLGLQILGASERVLHITLIAGSEQTFLQRLKEYTRWAESLWQGTLPSPAPEIRFHRPTNAAAFGSINSSLLGDTITIARETGILMDPVYSVKHLETVNAVMCEQEVRGPQLILFNGGALGVAGFQRVLASRPEL